MCKSITIILARIKYHYTFLLYSGGPLCCPELIMEQLEFPSCFPILTLVINIIIIFLHCNMKHKHTFCKLVEYACFIVFQHAVAFNIDYQNSCI